MCNYEEIIYALVINAVAYLMSMVDRTVVRLFLCSL
jgi:hypothetical protein